MIGMVTIGEKYHGNPLALKMTKNSQVVDESFRPLCMIWGPIWFDYLPVRITAKSNSKQVL